MTNDPRSALNRLIAAFEAHLDAAVTGDEESPAVVAAENALQDAFFTYDDAHAVAQHLGGAAVGAQRQDDVLRLGGVDGLGGPARDE